MPPSARLHEAVRLRGMLLDAELRVARAVGRTDDAGRIEAEIRSLEVFPADALMRRVGPGRLVAHGERGPSPSVAFARESEAARARIAELKAELRTHARARRRA